MLALILVAVFTITLFQFIVSYFFPKKYIELNGKHVVITGGSKGLGLSIAIEMVSKGAVVTLMARNIEQLKAAQTQIYNEVNNSAMVNVISVDVTNPRSVETGLQKATETSGPIYVLVCNAGSSITGNFTEITLNDFKRGMDLNYYGTLSPIMQVVPRMQQNHHAYIDEKNKSMKIKSPGIIGRIYNCFRSRQDVASGGCIIMIASGISLATYTGYSAYAPTKWALRGLADTLRNELLADGITVHIAYPPNMPTDGFEAEERTKPAVTQAIETSSVECIPTQKVAARIMKGLLKGHYNIPCSFDLWMLMALSNGLSPRNEPFIQSLISPFLVPVAMYYRWYWDRDVRTHASFTTTTTH